MNAFDQIKETIEAIKASQLQCVILLPNNDAGHSKIIEYVKSNNFKWFPSLPTEIFVNLYRNVSALIGNSSSGIHETPTLKIPTINIGTRQQGRERAENVIDVPYNKSKILEAIHKALFGKEFKKRMQNLVNPYGDGTSAGEIVNVLKHISLDGIIQKQFHD
jgi:UDP-N-acetylglucosamine 2-epimerase (non-hydrolysing)/GDP/UDP-N,N'-diacetylbacillosamine 2-epimerase (hydrolysing)